jgi:cell wall-associated NlpC family hydrolase
MATIKLFLSILCFAFAGSNGMLTGHLLSSPPLGRPIQRGSCRDNLVRAAQREIGVREKTGKNDGRRVEEYLHYVGLKKGQPWCAAYVSYIYSTSGFDKPRSGWSPDLFPASRLARSSLPGNVIGIYFKKQKRIAHVGIILKEEGDYIISAEGNTNIEGSREGDGVYLKIRHRRTIYKIADWVSQVNVNCR